MRKINPQILQSGLLLIIITGALLLSLSGYINPVVSSAQNPIIAIQKWVSERFLTIRDFLTAPRDVASLRQRNLELEAEVSQLQTQIIQLQQQISETQVLYALLDFARANPENQYVASSVIGRDPSPFLHYVIISHGSDDGLRRGMPVVTQNGLVGTVDAVTASAARVQLINDPGSIVNVQLENSASEFSLAGSITGEIVISMIPQDIPVSLGDIVLTSGLGGKYPANIMIGQVSSVVQQANELFQSGTVQSAVDFNTLSVVLVITNFKPLDIEPLIPVGNP
jgi:rod shape-determining protein MreC